jgi:transcriptional regulator with XRE-family HTH domain
MAKQTMGEIISNLRREQGLTQKDLADQMGVTDKAVSKWERNLSCPDISTIPHLAEALNTTVDTLMDVKPKAEEKETPAQVIATVLNALPVAMGVALAALAVMQKMSENSGYFFMAGLGIFCLAIKNFQEK